MKIFLSIIILLASFFSFLNAESDPFISWCYKNDVISNLSKRVGIKKYEFCEGKYEKRTEEIARMGGIHFLNEILKSDNMDKKLKDVYSKTDETYTYHYMFIYRISKLFNMSFYEINNGEKFGKLKELSPIQVIRLGNVASEKELLHLLKRMEEKENKKENTMVFYITLLIVLLFPAYFVIDIARKKYAILNHYYDRTKF